MCANSSKIQGGNQHSFMLLEFCFGNADYWPGCTVFIKRDYFHLFQWGLIFIISYLTTKEFSN